MLCPYCGHLLPKDAEKCDRCDWKRGAPETAEGKASDAVAVLLSVIPGLGHIYKGHRLAGFLWMAGAVPAGIFVFLAAIASAGFGIGLFFFYLIAVMLTHTPSMIASCRQGKMRVKSIEDFDCYSIGS
jgi:hypothetical protein